jgi:hypothetical protein
MNLLAWAAPPGRRTTRHTCRPRLRFHPRLAARPAHRSCLLAACRCPTAWGWAGRVGQAIHVLRRWCAHTSARAAAAAAPAVRACARHFIASPAHAQLTPSSLVHQWLKRCTHTCTHKRLNTCAHKAPLLILFSRTKVDGGRRSQHRQCRTSLCSEYLRSCQTSRAPRWCASCSARGWTWTRL